jgi:glycosyltransferase involved in cell wall biosynthesis
MRRRVLFLANHRLGRSPGQRFRFEQYLSYLDRRGFDCDVSPMIPDEKSDRAVYSKGGYAAKARVLMNAIRIRTRDWWHADAYDIVFVYREALMVRSAIFERLFARSRARVIVDFDDAIWLPAVSDANRSLTWLKDPDKTRRVIECADMVFAGNRYLADFAARFCRCVHVVPTTIDTELFRPVLQPRPQDQPIEIGWTGSPTTVSYFRNARGVLTRLKQRFGDRITFKLIGDETYRDSELGIQGLPWRRETELEDLSTFDIGIMPLPDNPWTRGKCGFKALACMALALPTVASPVGVNVDIIEDGVNGFLAASEEEWFVKLTRLIEDPRLRESLGAKGRETVVARYSTVAHRDAYVDYFNSLLEKPPRKTNA